MAKRLTIAVPLYFAAAFAAGAQVMPLDHFNCYFAEGPFLPIMAQLQDQFDVAANQLETIHDIRIVRFCNPVRKTRVNGQVTPIGHKDDHLTMYQISPQRMTARNVVVQNQFGVQSLRTGQAVILAVPTGKLFPPPTGGNPSTLGIPTDLDHFKCYAASGRNIDQAVNLTDQFKSGPALVLQPTLFCNPVQKTIMNPNLLVTPIRNLNAHLTCYVTTQGNNQATVMINNQFVPAGTLQQLPVFNSEMLCVPSLKLRWVAIPPITVFPPRGEELEIEER